MGLIDKSQLDPIELWAKQHIDVICTFHPISDWSLIFARLNKFFFIKYTFVSYINKLCSNITFVFIELMSH